MRRALLQVLMLVALLAFAPPALGAGFAVDDPGDGSDADTADGICADAGAKCTLRAAIEQANALAGADEITFLPAGAAPAPLTALPQVTDQLSIDGGGSVTVTFDAAATGNLLDLAATDSVVRAISFAGGGDGVVVNAGASGDRLDTVTVTGAAGVAIRAGAGSVRLDGVRAESPGETGIVVDGSAVTISAPTVLGSGGDGIQIAGSSAGVTDPEIASAGDDGMQVTGSGATIVGGRVHGADANGIAIGGQNVSVSRVQLFGNARKPIANVPGANGGIAPPRLQIGPRRADGSLPLTGSAQAGTLELWSGDPSSALAPAFLTSFAVAGDFTYGFPTEPAPGSVFSASVTGGGVGSSEFATVAVPGDVASPDVVFSRALDTQSVRVHASEPLDPGSVQKEDFSLFMAGQDRVIDGVSVADDRTSVTIQSSGWRAGEAGYVQLAGAGALTDAAGNANLHATRLRVAAAPGDFVPPLGGGLKLLPKKICLTIARRCRHTGMRIRFETTEAGKATVVVKRGNRVVGQRIYGNIVPGRNLLKWNGRLASRKLRAGRYRLLLYVQDMVGNVTPEPPIRLFRVRRVTR